MAFKAGIFEDSLIKFNLDLWTIFGHFSLVCDDTGNLFRFTV